MDPATSPGPGIAIDPVCGMHVVIDGAQYVSEHDGVTYYFCGKGCRLDFDDDPERYLAPDHRPSMDRH
jgi:YHS domain-containing protein